MSTRSAIVAKQPDGTFAGIYCHFDGYPEHHAPILRDHYSDPDKVSRLISLGDISILDVNVEPSSPTHSFDNRESGVVVAYMRDRGETGCEAQTGATVESVAERIGHNGYVYVFDGSTWTCNGKSLDEALADREE